MQEILSLIGNLGVLCFAATAFCLLTIHFSPPADKNWRVPVIGVVYGLASVLVVEFPIQGPEGSSFDTRAAPILIASYSTGPIGGAIAATIGANGRLNLGGPTAMGGAVSFYLYLATGLLFRRFLGNRPLSALEFATMGLIASVTVFPAFFIDMPFSTGLQVYTSFWHVLTLGNIAGTVMLGLMINNLRAYMTQRQEFHAILKTSPHAIITVDENRRIISTNGATEKMFGRTDQELFGRKIEILIPADKRRRHIADADQFIGDAGGGTRDMNDDRIVTAVDKFERHFPILVSLSKYNIGGALRVTSTIRDMTEMEAAREKLLVMTDTLAHRLNEAETANDSKNQFLANMSHELRTPLNAIIGFASLIKSVGIDHISKREINEYISDIQQSGENLLQMINAILDISKIENDATEFEIDEYSCADIIRNSVKLLVLAAREQAVSISVQDDLNHLIVCDLRTARQSLSNLLSNAVKFSAPDSVVQIYTESGHKTIDICVEDDGPGISDKVIDRLGEPFLRGDGPEIRITEGAGLGLAISKRFIESQNGEIIFERKPKGGTIARIRLPSRRDTPSERTPDDTGHRASVG